MARDWNLRSTLNHRLRTPDDRSPEHPVRWRLHGYHGVLRHVQREAGVQRQGPVHGGSGAGRLLELHHQCRDVDDACEGRVGCK